MLYKLCRCNKKIPYTTKMCDECTNISAKDKREENRHYDKTVRKHANIYGTKTWHILRAQCCSKFNGLDIYSYYINSRVEYGSLAHHIVPLEDDLTKCYELDNLIYLSRESHDLVHIEYNRSDKSKDDMQKLLRELIERYEEEFEI
ncbi:HNH endonuclease [Clostridium sp. CF012]|uniref:HNH endonuclease n=1 Tax=Clostridium sp. CF012 TaxID=2843319 RepID=UPI001C0DD128|nr:HNH endonuclease [Clostridium sp. CF012]MBU3145736.1 HNH endonuclease [Clostridium sp. CF012]